MFAIGAGETFVIGVVLLLTVGVQVLVAAGLSAWLRRIARRRVEPALARFAVLPLVGFGFFAASLGVGGVLLVRAFGAVTSAPPEEKARLLAEGIGSAMNAAAWLGALSWVAYLAAFALCLWGARGARR